MPRLHFSQVRFLHSLSLIVLIMGLQSVLVLGQKPGTSNQSIKVEDANRKYLLHIPRGFVKKQSKKLPLVLMLHGSNGTSKGAASPYYGNWKNLADREKFFVVFPQALGRPSLWKSWGGEETDDTKFLLAIIEKMEKDFPIDKNRVFMTGHSSGGYMSYSFAAAHADKVAAIGPVAGLYSGVKVPAHPVSVISFHGMADDVVGYESELTSKAKFKGSRGAVESAAFFARANNCAKSKRKDLKKGRIHIDTWAKGRNKTKVVLYSTEGWGHGWPKLGSRTVDATQTIWEFFKANPRKWGSVKKTKAKSKAKAK